MGNKNIKLNVLVACEESQTVTKSFREVAKKYKELYPDYDFNFNVYSCDLQTCSGGHPEWHFNCDVFGIIKDKGGKNQNGDDVYIDGEWDCMIAHPPCTFLAVSGARWYYHPDDKDLPFEKRRPHPNFPNRAQDREDGKNFFIALAEAKIPRVAVENPIGIMNTQYKKPQQVIQPFEFGEGFSKKTCLWLRGLNNLEKDPANKVELTEEDWVTLSSGRRLPKWYSDALQKSPEERRRIRSKTFVGIALAMAEQWARQMVKEIYDFDARKLTLPEIKELMNILEPPKKEASI